MGGGVKDKGPGRPCSISVDESKTPRVVVLPPSSISLLNKIRFSSTHLLCYSSRYLGEGVFQEGVLYLMFGWVVKCVHCHWKGEVFTTGTSNGV